MENSDTKNTNPFLIGGVYGGFVCVLDMFSAAFVTPRQVPEVQMHRLEPLKLGNVKLALHSAVGAARAAPLEQTVNLHARSVLAHKVGEGGLVALVRNVKRRLHDFGIDLVAVLVVSLPTKRIGDRERDHSTHNQNVLVLCHVLHYFIDCSSVCSTG